jgi:hypothetical protein
MKKLGLLVSVMAITVALNAQIHVANNGYVGVKTTTPEKEFTVNGSVRINATATIPFGSAISAIVTDQNACAYHLYSNYYAQDVFYVHGSGYLWCKLGGYFGSDIKLKKDIKNIDSPLSKLTQLHGVQYKYKDPQNKENEKDERIGLIAQEVEKIVPQVVKEMNDGTKAIAYTDLIGLMVEAMKEQQTQIEDLKKQVEKLSNSSKN